MAIVETILFLDDRLHATISTAEIEAVSSTHKGNMHNVRDANLLTYWKPNNDLVSNANIRADFTSGDNIATASQEMYMAVAYDPRNIDQTTIILQYDSADDPSFSGATGAATLVIDTTDQYPTCQWTSFSMPSPSKRYWRLMQRFADRSGAGRTIPIFYWGVYGPSDLTNLDTDGRKQGPGAGGHGFLGSAGVLHGPAGLANATSPGYPRQTFDVTLRTDSSHFETIRDGLLTGDLMHRGFFVQYEGLRNEAQANFNLCRVNHARFEALRGYMTSYELTIPFVTEAFV
jgi:hypothetical protein